MALKRRARLASSPVALDFNGPGSIFELAGRGIEMCIEKVIHIAHLNVTPAPNFFIEILVTRRYGLSPEQTMHLLSRHAALNLIEMMGFKKLLNLCDLARIIKMHSPGFTPKRATRVIEFGAPIGELTGFTRLAKIGNNLRMTTYARLRRRRAGGEGQDAAKIDAPS